MSDGCAGPRDRLRPDRSRIELSVGRVGDLFDPYDPFPVPSRDLSASAEAFIVDWARECPRGAGLSITLHISGTDGFDPDEVRRAIAGHFSQRERRFREDLAELLRIGRLSLLIGVLTLLACSAGGYLLTEMTGENPAGRAVREGLLILGWVANWRPLEIFLYDGWPIREKAALMHRLASAPVEVRRAGDARE